VFECVGVLLLFAIASKKEEPRPGVKIGGGSLFVCICLDNPFCYVN